MRLFIGAELDGSVRAAAAAAARRLQDHLRHEVPQLRARWIPAANLHITLWFLGEVADGHLPAIRGALEAPASRIRRFDLHVAGAGVFPPSGRPRVMWIGVQRGADVLKEIYVQLGERLKPLGFLPEDRPYTPHLTIARVKEAGGVSSRSVARMLEESRADCGQCQVTAVTLFRSRVSSLGAVYDPLVRVPLR